MYKFSKLWLQKCVSLYYGIYVAYFTFLILNFAHDHFLIDSNIITGVFTQVHELRVAFAVG